MEQQRQFASQVRVDAYPKLKEDFILRVLELPWAFISDESSLLDFTAAPDPTMLLERIKQMYGVDVSQIANTNIADILERIAARNS
jgi:hypothetical protein